MGFRNGAFAKVWSVEPKTSTLTDVRLSISRKNKTTGQYEQEFGGFVGFVGTAAAGKALKLNEGDRIKLGDVDVVNKYDKEKKITYTNFKCFSFDVEGDGGSSSVTETAPDIDDISPDTENDLPF